VALGALYKEGALRGITPFAARRNALEHQRLGGFPLIAGGLGRRCPARTSTGSLNHLLGPPSSSSCCSLKCVGIRVGLVRWTIGQGMATREQDTRIGGAQSPRVPAIEIYL